MFLSGFHDIFLDMKGHSPPCIVFGYFPDMDLAQSLRSDKGKSMGTNIFIKYAKQVNKLSRVFKFGQPVRYEHFIR